MADVEPVIDVRVRELYQLFNSLDPSPFYERALDGDAEEFIVGAAREFPPRSKLKIVVHIAQGSLEPAKTADVIAAISLHFQTGSELVQRQLTEFFRIGRWSLLVGVVALAVCFAVSGLLAKFMSAGFVRELLQESLLILGWVANWKPIEIFLYDWWPIVRRRNLFRRLAAASVEVATA